jgi:hypothetical protein
MRQLPALLFTISTFSAEPSNAVFKSIVPGMLIVTARKLSFAKPSPYAVLKDIDAARLMARILPLSDFSIDGIDRSISER